MDQQELKDFLVEVLDEYITPNPVEISKKWSGGKLILEPADDTAPKEVPVEVFFKKILSVRDSLRVLEQKLNGNSSLSQEDKASYQAYITKAYGSLTTFNILFKNGKDKFVGAGKGGAGGKEKKEKMTLKEAQERLNLNEYGKS